MIPFFLVFLLIVGYSAFSVDTPSFDVLFGEQFVSKEAGFLEGSFVFNLGKNFVFLKPVNVTFTFINYSNKFEDYEIRFNDPVSVPIINRTLVCDSFFDGNQTVDENCVEDGGIIGYRKKENWIVCNAENPHVCNMTASKDVGVFGRWEKNSFEEKVLIDVKPHVQFEFQGKGYEFVQDEWAILDSDEGLQEHINCENNIDDQADGVYQGGNNAFYDAGTMGYESGGYGDGFACNLSGDDYLTYVSDLNYWMKPDYTTCLWAKDPISDDAEVWLWSWGGLAADQHFFKVDDDVRLRLCHKDVIKNGGTPDTDAYTFLCVTWDDDVTNYTFYIDGVGVYSNTDLASPLMANTTFRLFAGVGDESYGLYTMLHDEMTVFNRTLSGEEIALFYTQDGVPTRVNTAPSDPSITLNFTYDNTNFTNESMWCEVLVDDVDGESDLSVDIIFMNSTTNDLDTAVEQFSLPTAFSSLSNSNISLEIHPNNFTRGDYAWCQVRVYDQEEYSKWVNSSVLGVENYYPHISSPISDLSVDEDFTAFQWVISGNYTDVDSLTPVDADFGGVDVISWNYFLNDSTIFSLAFDNATHKITLTPIANQSGSVQVDWQVVDSSLATDNETVIWTVNAINDAPVTPLSVLNFTYADNNFTNESMWCEFYVDDIDSATMSLDVLLLNSTTNDINTAELQWRLVDAFTDVADESFVQMEILEGNFTKDDYVWCQAVANDGASDSPYVNSTVLDVENYPIKISSPLGNWTGINLTNGAFTVDWSDNFTDKDFDEGKEDFINWSWENNDTSVLSISFDNDTDIVTVTPLSVGSVEVNWTVIDDDGAAFNETVYWDVSDFDSPVISAFQFFALDSNRELIGTSEEAFNSSNLDSIEFTQVNFTISDGGGLYGDIGVFITADGTDACALGNNQSSQCFNLSADTWVEFRNNTDTVTWSDFGEQGRGDSIICNFTQINSTTREYSCLLDEVYNPNVWKHYPLNFSDTKWQNNANMRVFRDNVLKIELDEGVVPVNTSDHFKLDARFDPDLSPQLPSQDLLGFVCNSSYVPDDSFRINDSCQLVAGKLPSELQDDGTKFRGVFTNNLTMGLGDVKYIFFSSRNNPNGYYVMKSYGFLGEGSVRVAYSGDGGASFTNLSDGYESEANVNWFSLGGADPTKLVIKVEANDTSNNIANSSNQVLTWLESFGSETNTRPLVDIIVPVIDANVSGNFDINFTIAEPEGDSYLTNITLDNGTFSFNVTEKLLESVSSFSFDSSLVIDGRWNLTVEACEDETADLLCGNDTHEVIIDNTAPLVIIDSPINSSYSNETIDFNFTGVDNLFVFEDLTFWYSNDSGIINYSINSNSSFVFVEDYSYHLDLWVNDTVGNENVTSVDFLVDTVNPSLVIINPHSGGSYSNNVPLELSAVDTNLDTVWYEIIVRNSGNSMIVNTTFSGNSSLTGLPSDNLRLHVYVNDSLGNIVTSSVDFNVISSSSGTGSNEGGGGVEVISEEEAVGEVELVGKEELVGKGVISPSRFYEIMPLVAWIGLFAFVSFFSYNFGKRKWAFGFYGLLSAVVYILFFMVKNWQDPFIFLALLILPSTKYPLYVGIGLISLILGIVHSLFFRKPKNIKPGGT